MKMTRLVGDQKLFPLEHRILNVVLLLGIFIAIACGIINFLLEKQPLLIMISYISILVLLVLYYLSFVKRKYTPVVLFLIFSVGFICIPVMWMINNGILGETPYFVIMCSAMIAVLLRGLRRILTICCFIALFFGLMLWEYNDMLKYADLYFGLFTTAFIMVSFFMLILYYYVEESNKAKDFLIKMEEKEMELKLARLDRLNIIGEMAATIGHEVRNPLTTVRGFLQTFQQKKEYAKSSEHLELMLEELDRANAIVSEFLSLAKNKRIHLAPTNLNSVIRKLFPLIQATANQDDKEVFLELNPIPEIIADQNEIKQLILNLVQNALDASDVHGKATIGTAEEDGFVVLWIKDTGGGMPLEVYKMLGIPFFTTKENGTGLGLPVCYRIAERHTAKIDVETSSAGTTFSIRFNIP